MTDEEKMKLARECAAKTFDDRARNFPNWSKTERHYANAIRQGERDYYDEVQSALAAINALAPRLEKAESYAEWQQRRGFLPDTVDWAILEYDEFMKDDAYDAQAVLDRIIKRLREVREILGQSRISS